MGPALLCVLILLALGSLLCCGNIQDEPRSILTVSPWWLSPGASVTLSCEANPPSAGWRFYWYKLVPDLLHNSYQYELLPGSNNGTEQNSYILRGQTHTAGFKCRAGRGNPVNYIRPSQPKFVWSTAPHPAASLTVSPDREQHFASASVSLSCEGHSAEWRVMDSTETGNQSNVSDCSVWGTMNGSSCTFDNLLINKAVYWCESASGEFSNAINLTLQDKDVLLVSPVRPVTVGASVSLSCRQRGQKTLSNVFFYHNDKLVQNDSRAELNISAASLSHQGFYKCGHSGNLSEQSWMSVKEPVFRPDIWSFPVLLVFGPIIICLFLVCCFRRGRGSGTEKSVSQDDEQQQVYSTLLYADRCIYETTTGTGTSGNGCHGANFVKVTYTNYHIDLDEKKIQKTIGEHGAMVPQ